jgi:hypothetical protein
MKQIVIILLVVILSSSSGFPRDTAREIYDAIRHEDVEGVRTSLGADTNVVYLVGEKQFTMLHFAAEHGSAKGTEILELLLVLRKLSLLAKCCFRSTTLNG